MTVRQSDVLVLGGGVIGLACALYLLRAGRSVTIIEMGTAGGAASHGNCGTITPSHCMPLATPGVIGQAIRWMLKPDAPLRIAPRLDFGLLEWMLNFAHRCNWTDAKRVTSVKSALLKHSRTSLQTLIETEKLDCGFESVGTMNVYRDIASFEKSKWLPKLLQENGIEIETLDGAQAQAREPSLNDSIVGAYFHPGDAHLRPDRYCAELARVVKKLGGEISEDTTITGFRIEGDRVETVVTDRGDFAGRDIVFALGAWSPLLAKQLDLRIPIQPGKGYSITYTKAMLAPKIPMTLKERAVCVTAWNSGYRLGSTMEFAGYDASINRTRLDALRRGAAEYLREPEGTSVVEEWYGWRPMTYDDLPLLGRPNRLKNLVMATGHGMLGVTMSASTGMLISEMICETAPSLDTHAFDPNRFTL
ncbi:MAG: FAD-dependent oxidoreductase [Rudaea sp.]